MLKTVHFDFKPNITVIGVPGFYVFESESGIGKTYLANCLKSLSISKEPVVSITYADYFYGIPIESLLKRIRPVLIMLDRFDLYRSDLKFLDTVLQYRELSIILCDCKHHAKLKTNFDFAHLDYSKDKLVVYCDTY